MADVYIYRIDHHGSLVRPPELVATREDWAGGEVSDEKLREIEDQYIEEAVRNQRKRSLTVVTDGHFRRGNPFDVWVDALDGFDTGTLDLKHRPLLDDTKFISEMTLIAAKATIPSPAAAANRLWSEDSGWADAAELGEALAGILHEELTRLFAVGLPFVQLDAHFYGEHLTGGSSGHLSLADAVAIDTSALAGVERPQGAAIGVCPAIRVAGSVDSDAMTSVFSIPADRWTLPYLGESASELELLSAVPADLDVCAGVVDAANPSLEDIDAVMERMEELDGPRDWDRIALSPNQGFADVAGRPLLSEDDQWRKLVHVETLARMCWGNEL